MRELLGFLAEHGYWIVFAWVLVDQLGIPAPSIPALIAAGALIRDGALDGAMIFALSIVATLAANLFWYELGRRQGASILKLVCKVSLDPDSCVRDTRVMFERHGSKSILLAHFLPGLDSVVHPLAGLSGMPLLRYVAYDFAGAALWTFAFVAPGWIFRDQLESIVELAERFGASALGVMIALFAIYLGIKLLRRSRLLRRLRMARITVHELQERLASGAATAIAIVDLRHADEHASSPQMIPGAIRVDPLSIEAQLAHLPREQEIVLYCS